MSSRARIIARFPWAAALAWLVGADCIQAETLTVTTLYAAPINPLNAVHPLWTPVQHYRGKTFVVVPDVKLRPMVTEIDDTSGKVTTVPLDPGPDYLASTDGHNRFTMGIDKDGYLHIAGDMHGYAIWASTYVERYQYQNMMYWRSNKALDVTGGFTFSGGATSTTAPPGDEWGGDSRFFNDRNGELFFSARMRAFTGGSLSGSEPFISYGIYRYSTSTGRWTALGGKVTPAQAPGAGKFMTILYWEHTTSFEAFQSAPRFDDRNRLHFAIAGNTAGTAGQGLIYACSDDGGDTWKKASGARIPGLPIRGKDGDPNQGDLIVRSTKVAQQSPLCVDKDGRVAVHGDGTWRTWDGTAWVPISGGLGILGPDHMLTGEGGSTLNRSAALGQPQTAHDTGFGQVFSLSELGLQTSGSLYGIGLPRGTNFVNATRMAVFKATFTPWEDLAHGGTASASSAGEAAPQAFDGNGDSKWFTGADAPAWLRYDFAAGITRTVLRYDLTCGGDAPERDPQDWRFQASTDGATWVTLDSRSGEVFPARTLTRSFTPAKRGDYARYRLDITATSGKGQGVQLAELRLIGVDATRVPTAPRIHWSQAGNGRAWLSWAPAERAESYTVKRGASQTGPFLAIAKGVTGCGDFADTACANGTACFYVVAGVNAAGEGPASAAVAVTPQAQKPRPPIIQTAVGHSTRVLLSWLPLWPEGATYNVKRASNRSGPFTTVAKGITALTWMDGGLTNDTPYFYVVSAENPTSGESADSAVISAAPFRWMRILHYRSVGKDDPGTASASAENPPGETAAKAFDGGMGSKWLMPANSGWLQYAFAPGETWAVTRYRMIAGQDAPDRDPTDWEFQGSSDGKAWITLDAQAHQTFAERNAVNTYSIANSKAYPMYRLNVLKNVGNGITQLAELELWADEPVAVGAAGTVTAPRR